jgi:hypothetical protein
MSVIAPAHFLDIVQRAARECRVPGTGPSAVTSQTGLNQRLVMWASSAWVEIQNLHRDWKFLRLSASWTTVSGTALYTTGSGSGTVGVAASAFREWVRNNFRCYLTATGTSDEQFLDYRDWEAFRNIWLFNANRSMRTRPYEVTIDPSYSVGLGPTPASGYTVTGEYYRKAVQMSADSDVPACPAEYYMLIVYAVMKKYGASERSPAIYQEGATQYNQMLPQMELQCLPNVELAGSLC